MILSLNGIIAGKGSLQMDADAQAFITAANITDTTQQNAVNKLVWDLKSASLWSKMKAIYPFVGGGSIPHKFNLKDPRDLDVAFRLVFSGGWTHNSTGATGDAINGFMNTFLKPASHQSLNSNGMGAYINLNTHPNTSDPIMMGLLDSISQASLIGLNSPTSIGTRLNGNGISSSALSPNYAGLVSSHKTSSTLTTLYVNGNSVGSGNSGGNLSNNNIYIGTINFSGTPGPGNAINSTFRFAYISDGLNGTEVSDLYTAVQTYQTTLGRQL